MSRRFWLTLLLILHVLPWPGSESFFSLFHAHSLTCFGSSVDSGMTENQDREMPDSYYSELWCVSDETVVYCEIENEVRESESESKDDRDHDSLDLFSMDWSARARSIASFQSTHKSLDGCSMTGINFCLNLILRC